MTSGWGYLGEFLRESTELGQHKLLLWRPKRTQYVILFEYQVIWILIIEKMHEKLKVAKKTKENSEHIFLASKIKIHY